jgi:alkanesulfonate monooxygenase SsuD/methylene tetrahydromethanopterin reductase-like flavin-dependent oxidoreductase (luciferase family)
MELGVFTFADVAIGGGGTPPSRRIPVLIEEIALADEVGLDVFGIGEHHRAGYAAAAPPVLLAAAAARTSRIRLTSAVTVLSTDDPVRVFEQCTALDHVSQGRAEVMVGRGAFPDSFRLFAEAGDDYDDFFDEKLQLLIQLRGDAPVTWSGRYRPKLVEEYLYPRPTQAELPVWVAVGGSPESAVRAGRVGAPMGIVALGGSPRRLVPLAALHRRALEQYGHAPQSLGLNLHGFVADTSQKAVRPGRHRGDEHYLRATGLASSHPRRLHGQDRTRRRVRGRGTGSSHRQNPDHARLARPAAHDAPTRCRHRPAR